MKEHGKSVVYYEFRVHKFPFPDMRGTVFLLYDSIEFRSQFRMLRSQIGGFTLVRTQIEDHPRVLLTVQTLTKPDTLPVAHTNGKLPSAGVIFKIRSEEHTSELQSLMRISYAVFCLKK